MSTTPTESRPIPTDARLVWMASERAAPLFRTLDRARAFDPLIVLLSILPAVVVMFAASCSSWDAAMSLLALDATGVPLPPEAVPAVRELVPDGSLRPAALWLAAGLLRLVGMSWPLGIMTASLLGGLALMAMIWLLAKGLVDRRLAFWAVLLAAFHPTLMNLLTCPVPVSAALAGSVAALWGHSRLAERGRWTPARLAAVVLGIAAALLLAGPIALAGVLVIVADALASWIFKPRLNGQARLPRTARPYGQLLLLRLAAAGAGVGLWLALGGLVPEHRLMTAANAEAAATDEFFGPLNEPDMQIGPLWGLVAIGVGRLFRSSQRRGGSRASRSNPRLLLIWLVVGVAVLFWFPRSSEAYFEPSARFVLAGASVPMLITAGFAIEEAARRAVSGAWVLLAILIPLSMRVGDLLAMVSLDSPSHLVLGVLAVAILGWLLVLVLRAIVPLPAQRRGMLMLAVLLAIGVDASDGIRLVFREEWRGSEMDRLMAQLREEQPRGAAVLLTDSPPPVKLVFALRGVHADVPMEIAPTWDEAVHRLNRRTGGDWSDPLAAAWGLGEAIGAASPETLRPAGEPMLFEGRSLLLYVAERPTPSPAETNRRP